MAALAIAVRHALCIKDTADLVRFVAIDAGGYDVWLLFPEFAANHLLVDGLDLGVALRTCLGDVLF